MRLIILGGEPGERCVPVDSPFVIGRGAGCQLRVDGEGVEEEHLRIEDGALVALAACVVGEVPLVRGARRLAVAGHEILLGTARLRLADDPLATPSAPTHVLALEAVQRARPHARVLVVEGAAAGTALALLPGAAPAIVGRAADADVIVDDEDVSRRHLRITLRGRDVVVEDLGATHGSWLGRARLAPHRPAVWAPRRMLRLGTMTVLAIEPALEIEEVLPSHRSISGSDAAKGDEPGTGGAPGGAAAAGVAARPVKTPDELPTSPDGASAGASAVSSAAAPAPVHRAGPQPPSGGARVGHLRAVDILLMVVTTTIALLAIAGLVWVLST